MNDKLWKMAALLLAGGLVAGDAVAGDVAIMPSMLELAVDPGGDVTKVVQIHYGKDGPDDTRPIRVMLGVENWTMNSVGDVSFSAADARWSAKPWIVFSPSEAEIRPGEIMTVRVSVIVPEDTEGGEYRAALIAQPRMPFVAMEQGERRLELVCRLAAILYVEVPPVLGDVELGALQVTQLAGRWHAVPRFHNPGNRHLRVLDSFEILPLADPPTLVTCDREEQEAGVILPGQSRQFLHPLPCDLPPGWYRLLYRADVGANLPIQEGETTFVIAPSRGETIASAEAPAP
ncbi:MAG: hypothetical protein ACRDGR_10975 [bacterium]